MKSGLSSVFTSGRWPKGASYVSKLVNGMRHQIEQEILDRFGAVDVHAAALIQSAARHETRALLLQRWLRESELPPKRPAGPPTMANGTPEASAATKLPLMERLAILEAIGRATEARDRCLSRLGLARQTDVPADDGYGSIPGPAAD